jgi:CRISPR-associated endonuclease/helicase Cas3
MSNDTFPKWFESVTGHSAPRPWQIDLAEESACRTRLIRIPTGLGKTDGVLAAWSFHRLQKRNGDWPRRLVWCLPMRVLVDQTVEEAQQLASRMDESVRPTIHVAMGGEDSSEWYLFPEHPAVIIGTQDMLLSRALNRGYASGRARWPMEFGLLNQDALWVMDEVQLMDVGLATSAQIQAFRDDDGGKHLRPCHTWWMSATLQPDWLRSVDTVGHHPAWTERQCMVPAAARSGGLWDIPKSVETCAFKHDDHPGFARRILEYHGSLNDGEFGKVTLVVCNTVQRACKTFDALRNAGRSAGLELVHSRFRPAEREGWRSRFLSREACAPGVDRIIVATQVVEAGVDISAGCLVTELAPWPSLVQRFGRCARYGGNGSVLVVDRGRDDKQTAPYQPGELGSAWDAIQGMKDVGIRSLDSHEEVLDASARHRLFPYASSHLILRKEFDELFDTTPDLTGADLDISRFIRSGDERDVQVFWDAVDADAPPQPSRQPHRRELCPVPFLIARDWLCGPETKTAKKPKLRRRMRAWVWDWLDGAWIEATRAALLPGRVVCVAAQCGGYRADRGFDAEASVTVPAMVDAIPSPAAVAFGAADDQQDGEQLSCNPWKTIACHSQEVGVCVRDIADCIGLPSDLRDHLDLAACWHDWGKSHPAFQGAIRGSKRPERQDLAKGPTNSWRSPPDMYRFMDNSESRPAFRHELASVLGLFSILQTYAPNHDALLGPWVALLEQMNQPVPGKEPPEPASMLICRTVACSAESFDLMAYLVVSHHGKVRVGLHPAPKDQDYRDLDGRGLPIRGVREGDVLPSVELMPGDPPIPAVTLTLAPASLGLSFQTGISWRERCIGVLERHGPAALAFLEAILRAADVRASRLMTDDPALAEKGIA